MHQHYYEYPSLEHLENVCEIGKGVETVYTALALALGEVLAKRRLFLLGRRGANAAHAVVLGDFELPIKLLHRSKYWRWARAYEKP